MIKGSKEFEEKLARINSALRPAITRTVNVQTAKLQRYIVRDKLSGQVLHMRTGALARGIHSVFAKQEGSDIIGRVSSSKTVPKIGGERVPLMAVHEFGALITAKRAKYLRFKVDGHWVMKKSVTIPSRPVMRPSLKEREPEIKAALQATLRKVIHES